MVGTTREHVARDLLRGHGTMRFTSRFGSERTCGRIPGNAREWRPRCIATDGRSTSPADWADMNKNRDALRRPWPNNDDGRNQETRSSGQVRIWVSACGYVE